MRRPDLPPDTDARLDDLLARWADARRLTPADADAIRRAVLAAPSAAPDEWWLAFADQLTTTLLRALGGARLARSSLPLAVPPDYHPYLRLAAPP